VDSRVKVITLNPPIRRGFLSRLRLGRAMGKQLAGLRPDVIFLPGNFHLLLAGGLRKAASRPVIAAKISNPPLPPPAPFTKPAIRHVTRAVNGFAAMNNGLARDLRALLPGRDIVTLYDPVYIRPSAAVSRKSGRNILWIGRLEPQKNPELALKVLQALGGDAHLTMLGDGALNREIHGQVSALGLQDKVTLPGHVLDIASYLADADALLITSRYEGGPAVAVEALALGVPVVGTDCSYLLQDLITLPEAGRIVASREAAAIATALTAVCALPRPPRERLAALAAPFEPGRRAQDYLDWFDRLTRERHG
jgi:glycosyltransferase involved in cell wall biosynthesis